MTTTQQRKPAKKAGAAKAAASAAQPEEDRFSDELLGEVDLDGVPPIREFHQLNRRRRATLTRQLSNLLPGLTRYEQMLGTGVVAGDSLVAADGMEFLADVEDMLATLAVDPEALRLWAQTAEDTTLIALFARFARSMNSGEAKSSSS